MRSRPHRLALPLERRRRPAYPASGRSMTGAFCGAADETPQARLRHLSTATASVPTPRLNIIGAICKALRSRVRPGFRHDPSAPHRRRRVISSSTTRRDQRCTARQSGVILYHSCATRALNAILSDNPNHCAAPAMIGPDHRESSPIDIGRRNSVQRHSAVIAATGSLIGAARCRPQRWRNVGGDTETSIGELLAVASVLAAVASAVIRPQNTFATPAFTRIDLALRLMPIVLVLKARLLWRSAARGNIWRCCDRTRGDGLPRPIA